MKNPPIKTALFSLLLSSLITNNLQAEPSVPPTTSSKPPAALSKPPAAKPPAAPTKYVTDNASVLHPGTADRLSSQLADFYRKSTDELLIVINPNLPTGVSIGEYARQLYAGWKIGQGKDTGALLLICTQERQGRIHAGRGLANKLSEDVSKKIFIETIAPRLDAGDYDGACKAAVTALIAALSR